MNQLEANAKVKCKVRNFRAHHYEGKLFHLTPNTLRAERGSSIHLFNKYLLRASIRLHDRG
jgi:hypothetical protein